METKDLNPDTLQRGDVLYHRGGRYTAVVYDVLIDARKRRWFSYFIVENCDETYEPFKDAILKQDDGPDGLGILKATFYEATHLYFLSESRFLRKFTKQYVEPTPLTEAEIIPSRTEEIVLEPEPVIPPDLLMSPEAASLQDMAPVVRRSVG